MPEIPELEAIKNVLNSRLRDQKIEAATVRIPVVIRRPSVEEFVETLTDNRLLESRRAGKYLILGLASGHVLAINLMLTGRLQLADAGAKLPKRTSWVLAFENGQELRYFGERLDGRVYLVRVEELALIPRFAEMGPDALDPALTFEDFRQRIRRFPGQIKRVLVGGGFVAGIGNAYVDEILFEARIYPFEPSKNLSEERLRELFDTIGRVYRWAIPIVAESMGGSTEHKIRDFLKVHRKGGQPCPRCGTSITEVTPNRRITSYCRTCQGWGEAKLRGSSVAAPRSSP